MKRSADNLLSRYIFPFILMLLFAAPAFAEQPPERIRVVPGGAALVLEGKVARGGDIVYIFSAAAGLTFIGRITSKANKAGFAVTGAEGRALPEEEFDFNQHLTGTLEKAGDYRIAVSTFETEPIPYKLTVRVHR